MKRKGLLGSLGGRMIPAAHGHERFQIAESRSLEAYAFGLLVLGFLVQSQ